MKEQILDKAMQLSARKGFRNVTRQDLATAVGCATGSISYHFKTMRKLQGAMVDHAIVTKNLVVLGQALAEQPPNAYAAKAPPELKRAAARTLTA